MIKNIKILCTLGPSSLDPQMIQKLDEEGVDLFRINLSHTKREVIDNTIVHIKSYTDKPLCLDTEGAQVRTGELFNGNLILRENQEIKIPKKRPVLSQSELSLTPVPILCHLREGDQIDIEFGAVSLEITGGNEDFVFARVSSGGAIGSNKAVFFHRKIDLPPLTEKDNYAVQLLIKHKLESIALSFANRREDVECLREKVPQGVQVISKIESEEGVRNFSEIASASDALLIDRGDLGSEAPPEKIPFIQKALIREANQRRIPIYVATNLLESMVTKPRPTRAEVSDVIHTLIDGADGLVLAAETAVGAYPLECVRMIKKLIEEFSLAGHV